MEYQDFHDIVFNLFCEGHKICSIKKKKIPESKLSVLFYSTRVKNNIAGYRKHREFHYAMRFDDRLARVCSPRIPYSWLKSLRSLRQEPRRLALSLESNVTRESDVLNRDNRIEFESSHVPATTAVNRRASRCDSFSFSSIFFFPIYFYLF